MNNYELIYKLKNEINESKILGPDNINLKFIEELFGCEIILNFSNVYLHTDNINIKDIKDSLNNTIFEDIGLKYSIDTLSDQYIINHLNGSNELSLHDYSIIYSLHKQIGHDRAGSLEYDTNYHWCDCTVCQTELDKTPHDISGSFSFNPTQHWKDCKSCEYNEEVEEHYYENRILEEYTGLSNIYLHQFKAFGSPNRSSYADEPWMEKVKRLNISRLVTVGYVALIKINNRIKQQSSSQKGQIVWLNIEDYRHEHLAFDHKDIIAAALENIRHTLKFEPYLMFELLPKKFTMTQLRNLHDTIYQKKSDVRNFQKRMMQLEGISALAETEIGVPHRAARYFTYNKRKNKND